MEVVKKAWSAFKKVEGIVMNAATLGCLGLVFLGGNFAVAANPTVLGMASNWISPAFNAVANPVGPQGFITGFTKMGSAIVHGNWGSLSL